MCIYLSFIWKQVSSFLVLSRMNFYVQKNTKGIVYEFLLPLRFLYENQRKTKMIGKNTFYTLTFFHDGAQWTSLPLERRAE